MKNFKSIKRIWKAGTIGLVVMALTAGGLFLNLKSVLADPAPNMTIKHLGLIGTSGNWSHSVTLNPGDEVQFYAEIHNTIVGSTAHGVRIRDNVTGGTFTDGTSVATVSATDANSATDTVNIHINGGGQLQFIANSARVTWDVNGDGTKEFNNTFVAGNPMAGDLVIGDQHGCNQYIIQVGWAARVVGGTQPSPTPTSTPVASPTPPSGGQEQHQEQTQNNNQNQTVNITNTSNPQVLGTSVPKKSPDTGVSVAGLMTMFGAGPVGLALARFGRGKAFVAKKKENLSELAKNLVDHRFGKSQDA